MSNPSPSSAPPPDPFPGEYRLVRPLGQGAFGTVWLAEDVHLGRQVALKTVRPRAVTAAARALDALRHEARLLAGLKHPSVVQVFAWRQSGDEHFLVLQYVAGGSLKDHMEKHGPLSWQTASRYAADVAEALVEIHRCGIIHRDVKPANILLDTATDEAVLTDFGISARLSDPNTIAGSPAYMAPEAFLGRITPALDVYSLAATLFRLLTGEVPFPDVTLAELQEAVSKGLPDPDPRCSEVPGALEKVIRRGLAPTPETRPAMAEFAKILRGSLNQLLADTLSFPASGEQTRPEVWLRVSRSRDGRTYETVAATQAVPPRVTRDLKRVPPSPDQIQLRTGDKIRIEAAAGRAGYLTVFNVGPAGTLNLLVPDVGQPPVRIEAGGAVPVLEVELTPPAGRERLFAVWTRSPLPLRPEDLRSLVESGPTSTAYRATRDLKRVQQAVQGMQPEDWRAVVLELDHVAG